jgi:hypothetical protein
MAAQASLGLVEQLAPSSCDGSPTIEASLTADALPAAANELTLPDAPLLNYQHSLSGSAGLPPSENSRFPGLDATQALSGLSWLGGGMQPISVSDIRGQGAPIAACLKAPSVAMCPAELAVTQVRLLLLV